MNDNYEYYLTEPLNFSELIESNGCSQPRTSISKAFTVPFSETIIKGPYKTNSVRLNNVLQKSKRFKEWNTPCIVHPIGLRTMDDFGDDLFIVFPNMNEEEIKHIGTNKESFSDYEYPICDRGNLIKLGDFLGNKFSDFSWINGQEILLALLHGFVLCVGDMHLSNILVDLDKHLLHYIDYEDANSEDPEPELTFYMTIRPAPKKLEAWKLIVQRHYKWASENLKELKNLTVKESKRRDQAIKLLKEFELDNRIGYLKFSGGPFSGSYSRSGFTPDILKSGIQKFIRRGLFERAFELARELYMFEEVGGKMIQTMLFNRLSTISCEDIGMANLPLALAIVDIMKNDRPDLDVIYYVVREMCSSKKSRSASHLYAVYANPFGMNLAEKYGIKNTDELIDVKMEIPPGLFPDDEGINFLLMMRYRIQTGLAQEDRFLAFYWFGLYMNSMFEKKLVKRRMRKTDPTILVFIALKDLTTDRSWEILYHAYCNSTEKRPYIMCLLQSVVMNWEFDEDASFEYVELFADHPGIDLDIPEKLFEFTPEERAYVVDKHTGLGKLNGHDGITGSLNFTSNGAHVENEDGRLIFPIHKALYEDKSRFDKL